MKRMKTAEQLRDEHNAFIDSLNDPQFEIWKIGKTPYEIMVEFLENVNNE